MNEQHPFIEINYFFVACNLTANPLSYKADNKQLMELSLFFYIMFAVWKMYCKMESITLEIIYIELQR